jgi:hypothetical protein
MVLQSEGEMIHRLTISAFADELSKLASMTGGQKLLLGTGLAGGAVAGAYGQAAFKDAQEGRALRRGREFSQKQQLKLYAKGVDDE